MSVFANAAANLQPARIPTLQLSQSVCCQAQLLPVCPVGPRSRDRVQRSVAPGERSAKASNKDVNRRGADFGLQNSSTVLQLRTKDYLKSSSFFHSS
uniref:Uncharacterized protein n=1 Tax=Knipowitschia caucasica TaxID=637954 RepID=A0AAV2MI98_KNICA